MSSEDLSIDVGEMSSEAEPVGQKAERMVPQSEVDKAIYAVKMRAREEAQAQYRQQPQAQGMGGMQAPGVDEEALMSKLAARMQKQLDAQQQAQQLEHDRAQVEDAARVYLDKMKQGPQLYADFDEVTGDYNPAAFPQVSILAAQMDNTPDIMYELNKNPTKLTHLHSLARANLDMARKEMVKLSQSIKQNEEAVNNNVKSPSPLTKLKPSTIAGSDSGKKSISDLRKQPWLRG